MQQNNSEVKLLSNETMAIENAHFSVYRLQLLTLIPTTSDEGLRLTLNLFEIQEEF